MSWLLAWGGPVTYAQSVYTAPYAITTLAGLAGSDGSVDGTGGAARFYQPSGVAVDSAGNVIVADTFNDTIRKITPAGGVSTLAGFAGSDGSADGTGGTAQFSSPYGVAVDSAGNIYVADSSNSTIRKITPAGVVSTLAGLAGSDGSTDGAGSDARFYFPSGVAVDSAGNVYVADSGNSTIRKITPAGVVSTLAGFAGSDGSVDGAGSVARFNYPAGVAVDSAGNVTVADYGSNTIRLVTPAGMVSTLAGFAGNSGSADGTGSAARFNLPAGVAMDDVGNIYVADSGNSTIRQITPAGLVSTLAGLTGSNDGVDGTGSVARFYLPTSVAVDSAGNVYVADSNNSTIRKGTATTTTFAQWQSIHFGSNATNAAIAGPSADPDRDGISNLLEDALGADPLGQSRASLPAVAAALYSGDGRFHLTLTVGLNAAATDLIVNAEVSSDLQTWSTGSSYTAVVSDTTTGSVRTLVIRDTTPLGSGVRRCMRLKVTGP